MQFLTTLRVLSTVVESRQFYFASDAFKKKLEKSLKRVDFFGGKTALNRRIALFSANW